MDPTVRRAWDEFASNATWAGQDLSEADHARFVEVTRAVSRTGDDWPNFAALLRAEGLDEDRVQWFGRMLSGVHEMVMAMWGKGPRADTIAPDRGRPAFPDQS